jgi:hypothetical protein
VRHQKWANFLTCFLLVALLAFYVAAKFDFFTVYRWISFAAYVRHHAIYWTAMALIGLAICAIEKLSG